MSDVFLITDGSADNSTGSGGWCAIVRTPTSLAELVGFEENTTSNRMELMAAIEGLRAISTPSNVTLISDSAYLLNTLKNKWYERWLQDERLGLKSKPRPNMDQWRLLIGLTQFHDVTCAKVKGHSGDYWNERADRLADYARTNHLSYRNVQDDFKDQRCTSFARSGRQCKLHLGHSGEHHHTNAKANGVAVYGDTSTTGERSDGGDLRSALAPQA